MDWIVEEVIPSIRKTGGYGSNVPKTYSEALLEAGRLEAEKERLLKEVEQSNSKIKKLTPYAEVGKAFAEREGSCKIGQFCKCIRIDGRVMGQNKMFEFMREIGFLSPSPRNEPYQYHVDAGRAYLAQGEHPENGRMVPHFTPMLTVKGQCYLVTRMQDHPSFIENSIVVSSKILNIVPED
jgi:anti-repressor protein